MSKRKVMLTDIFCRTASSGDWRDAGSSGLILRVGGGEQKQAVRTWGVRYSRKGDGKQRRHTIGLFQDIKLVDARHAAGEILKRVRAGEDPAADAEERRTGHTFNELVQLYFARNKSLADNTRLLYSHFLGSAEVTSAIGNMPPRDITKSMIREIVDKIEKRGAAVAADKARIAISSVFGWAIETGAVKSLEDNPARAIAMRSTNEPRRRPWTNEELKSVWNALDGKTRTSTALIVRLVAVTACRRAEVTGAKISEFDILNARWTIPGKSRGKKGLLIRGRTKSQNEKVVPLSPFALELVERAIKLASDRKKVSPTKGEDYLFPSFGICKTAHVDPHSITRAIARIAKALIIHDLHLHDLRTTCRTWMRGVGISSDVRDAVLGHKGETVGERVYEGADLNFIEQRVRPAMEIWSNHLISVVAV